MPSAMLPALAQASAAFAIWAASESREWISVRQATIASLKTGLAMAFPQLMGDSDAPVAAEVERILSNLMAHIAPYRSRTCWRKDGRQAKARKTRRRLAQRDLT